MPSSGLRSLVFLALCCPAAAAAAGHEAAPTVFCIANSTQLKAAFVQMAADADAGNTPARYQLQIQKGSYFPPIMGMVGTLDAPISSVELLGGYDAGCTTRTIDPENTSLNIGSTGSAPQLGFTTRGDVLVEGLSLISAYPSAQTSVNDVLALRQAPGSLRRQHWSIRQTIFQGKAAQGDANPDNGALNAIVGAVDTPPVSLAVENVIAKGFGDGDCVFQYREIPLAFPLPGHELVFSHATIAYNSTCAIGAEGLHAQSRVVLTNNVIAQNGGSSVTTAGHADANVELHNNVLTSAKSIGNKLVLERNTLTNNPLLVSYADPRPGALSIAINSGTTYIAEGLSATDLRGGARWVGSRPDRGAIEATDADDTTHYVVTNTEDSGAGSLRAAIEAANAEPGPASVTFNILAGSVAACPAVIRLESKLEPIDDVIIDGFSQPEATPNTLEVGDNAVRCVALDGGSSGGQPITAIASQNENSDVLVVKGIEFGGFGTAVYVDGPDEFTSYGNRFGGTVPVVNWGGANGEPIKITGSFGGVDSTEFVSIGSLRNPGARNVFFENFYSLKIAYSRAAILANVIDSPLEKVGINLVDVENGGALISNSIHGRVTIEADATTSSIPLRASKNIFANSVDSGFLFFNRGGVGGIRGAVVEENDLGAWVWLVGAGESADRPFGITYSRNRALTIGAALRLQDDLDLISSIDNDVLPASYQTANRGQNYPELASAAGGAVTGEVSGSLHTRTGRFVIEMFANAACDASGHGDGEELIGIGTIAVQDNGVDNGTGQFTIPVRSAQLLSGRAITATATDEAGNTSEFSACITYDGPPVEVFRDGFEEP